MSLSHKAVDAKSDICDVAVVHFDAVQRACDAVPDLATIQQVAAIFQVLADVTRARIVAALTAEELCVCDVAAVVGLSISAASHQLKRLRDCGIVQYRKEGRMVYYRLGDEPVQQVLSEGIDHIGKGKTV